MSTGGIARLQVERIGTGALHLLLIPSQTPTPIISIHKILPIIKSRADFTKLTATNMSPINSINTNNPNNNNNNNPASSSVTVSNNDIRCRFCGHTTDARQRESPRPVVAKRTAASASTRASSFAPSIQTTKRRSLSSSTLHSRSMPLPDSDRTSSRPSSQSNATSPQQPAAASLAWTPSTIATAQDRVVLLCSSSTAKTLTTAPLASLLSWSIV